jgi:hypothetical protein
MILAKNNFNIRETKVYLTFVIIFFLFQIFFWFKTEKIKPNLGIVPEVPTLSTIKAFSFGDEEFYFRNKALRIQNTGDTFGRFSPLKDYDYKKLTEWFRLLDGLDSISNYVPSMAAYYYSMTQNEKDSIYLINYLEEHANRNPKEKWWWYYQAASIAKWTYKDDDLAIKLAKKLKDSSPDDAPGWTKRLLPIMLSEKGEDCEAIRIIFELLENYENKGIIKDSDIDFMNFFIAKKIQQLKEKKFDIRKCKLNK